MARPFSPRSAQLSSKLSQRNAISKAREFVTKGEIYRMIQVDASSGHEKTDTRIKLKNDLYKYTKSNDRRMVVRILEESKLLKCIRLAGLDGPSAENESGWLKLEEEVTQTKINLNGVILGGPSEKQKREMLVVLEKLCERLTMETDFTAEELFQAAILRLTRSHTASEVHTLLNSLLGNPDLLVQPSKEESPASPKLEVFADGDCVHILSENNFSFGLLRKIDLSTRTKAPWITLVISVHERINLNSRETVRYCALKVVEKKGYL